MQKATLLMGALGLLVVTGCETKHTETHRVETTRVETKPVVTEPAGATTGRPMPETFAILPEAVQEAARFEIGDSQILGARPATLAGNSGYYEVHYMSEGRHKALKIDEWGRSISKSDWGAIIEAAGAERNP